MIIDCISDLHGNYPELEGGDLLIVSGDLTKHDRPHEYDDFSLWLVKQKYKKKVLIAGNHDNFLEKGSWEKPTRFFDYLFDSGTEFEGLKIWGSPWTKTFPGINPKCKAFTLDTEEEITEKWALIPDDIDILITHSPPHGILDKIIDGRCVGSYALFGWLKYVGRPRLHIFGHIHESYGKSEVFPTYDDKMMISVNASHVDENYKPVNKPIRIIL